MSLRFISLFITLLLFSATNVCAYEREVHQRMSINAYNQAVLDPITGSNLSELLGQGSIQPGQYLANGSWDEDDTARPIHHFYDPVTKEGILNVLDAIGWGLEPEGSTSISGQDWSIRDARNYLYLGVTGQDPTFREKNLANTFLALGHVIHLIQDMAQPQHVRSDPHYHGFFGLFDNDRSRYEEYTLSNQVNLSYTGYPSVIMPNYRSYWDGSNSSGLAELTNMNFFTEVPVMNCNFFDRCIEERNGVRYEEPAAMPSSRYDIEESLPAKDGGTLTGMVTYFPHSFTDPITNQTVTNPKALTFSYFDLDLEKIEDDPRFARNRLTFNEDQKILVKRAVGYSAGLINYFFRGSVDALPYGNSALRAINHSAEPIDGEFWLYYDDINGIRKEVQKESWAGISLNPEQASTVLYFTTPTDAREPGKYILVFRGQMGAEDGAVAAKIVEIIPQHVFIIQQTLSLNSTPTQTTLVPEGYYVYREGGEKSWAADQQVRTGHFSIEGTVSSIKLVGSAGGKLYLDDQLISSNEWKKGDPPTAPSQWRVEGPGFQALEVKLENDVVVRQGLFSFGDVFADSAPAAHSIWSRSFEDAPCNEQTYPLHECSPDGDKNILDVITAHAGRDASFDINSNVGEASLKTLNISGAASLSVLMEDQFTLPDKTGMERSINDNGEVSYRADLSDPPADISYLYVEHNDVGVLWPVVCDYTAQEFQDYEVRIVEHFNVVGGEKWYQFDGGSFYNSQTGKNEFIISAIVGEDVLSAQCPDPYDYYDTLTVPDEIPLSLSGQIDRKYSQDELDYLDSLGIEPVPYSIQLSE